MDTDPSYMSDTPGKNMPQVVIVAFRIFDQKRPGFLVMSIPAYFQDINVALKR